MTTMIRFSASKMLLTADGKLPLDISFELEKGKLLTIYGNSGAGKTTVLRVLAGLTDIDAGRIEVGGETWRDTSLRTNLPARKRSVGLVFQDFALFPHLTVRENLEFAAQNEEDKRVGSHSLVDELIDLMELQQLQKSKPSLLSGGQQQRVALARAIVRRPSLLLLDEPLSALDDEMRFKLQDYIITARRRYGLTIILVSHYLPEIFRLSDEVICLEKGKIRRQGNPADIFSEEKISGKFKVTGEVVEITRADIVYIVTVLHANMMVKVIATEDEVKGLRPGDKVLVASKAFNPAIIKIS